MKIGYERFENADVELTGFGKILTQADIHKEGDIYMIDDIRQLYVMGEELVEDE